MSDEKQRVIDAGFPSVAEWLDGTPEGARVAWRKLDRFEPATFGEACALDMGSTGDAGTAGGSMSKRKKPAPIPWDAMTPEQKDALASWLWDQAHDREVEREEIADYHGFDFVAAIEGLAEYVGGAE